jgi:hypothetical protein
MNNYEIEEMSYLELLKLAQDVNTSKKVLEKLSTNTDWQIRFCVAKNPNTPPDVLKKLSSDKHYGVCFAVSNNPNTPIYILKILSKSWDNDISDSAITNLENKKEEREKYEQL